MHVKLKKKLEAYIKISVSLQTELNKHCDTIRVVKKNEVLIKYGGIYNKSFFIVKGSFKSSLLDPKGYSKTIWFYFDELFNVIPVKDKFLFKGSTKYEVTALENSEVIEIDMDILLSWIRKYPEFNEFFRMDMINSFTMSEEIRTHLICYSKKDFLDFLHNNYPVIALRTPSYALADFMGITREWLSKLKRQQLNKLRE